ncbi:MAG: biosynthetic-type acetolactate synthase large subunit, partial [Oscillospiraceae bacterium]|nr:biosynthetic-type acetolactate synthase large subunit [Oscillospiraceae bacterium]
MKMTGAAITIQTLINHGVDVIFGYPGGAVLYLYDELYKNSDKIKHYIFCHEQGATHAADGYARATGKTGVVFATSGPGSTNLVTGIATAYMDSTPMIAITGNVPLGLIGKDSFQEIDIAGITMPITKHNYIVKNINELEAIICEAFQIARSGRPGAVLIDIPKDIQTSVCEFKGGKPWELFPHPVVSDEAIIEAAEIINNSKKPYIYAGGGVISAGASEELQVFAEKIDAPIGCSMMGLSAVNHKLRNNIGMTGMHGTYVASAVQAKADLIIGVGVRFSDRATGNKIKYQENAKILHIDIDKSEIGKNVSAYNSLVGDAKDTLTRLTSFAAHRKLPKWWEEINGYACESRNTPKEIIQTVHKYMPDDAVIVTDVGQHQMWVAQYYKFSKPRTFLTSGGLGTMGFGMGAAIGAAIGTGRRIVLFTGDGSFHMNMNEFATAVTNNIPLIVIILNNNVLGMVRQWQNLFFESRYSNTTLERKTDYVKLAESLGGKGFNNDFESALQQALTETVPVIIECKINKDEKVFP